MEIVVREENTRLASGEILQSIVIPDYPYENMKPHLKRAEHLAVIESLPNLADSNGVIVKCKYKADGLMAAALLIRKREMQQEMKRRAVLHFADDEESDLIFGNGVEQHYDDHDEYPLDEDEEDEEDNEEEYENIKSLLYKDEQMVRLPVVSLMEFGNAMGSPRMHMGHAGPFHTAMGEGMNANKPYWFRENYPIIVDAGTFGFFEIPNNSALCSGRFIIYLTKDKMSQPFPSDFANLHEQKMMFEWDLEFCQISEPSMDYYCNVLNESVKRRSCKLSSSLDKAGVIDNLKSFRQFHFNSVIDIEMLVNRTVKRKTGRSRILSKNDFDRVLLIQSSSERMAQVKHSAVTDLDQLIGLHEVKGQLKRMIERMKFDKKRKESGYNTGDTHLAAVFMGNPGTAKTTVARLFGRMLFEENVLTNPQFMEVSRKDLVGQFVGWTGPNIARVFEQVKGGTLFIDEAYSLMSSGSHDNFSAEALSEIIRQMENNPDTLVIFAGYTAEMKDFIMRANPGLRSRLTNVIEFADYNVEEMFDIFIYTAGNEDFILDQTREAKLQISRFIERMRSFGNNNIGNGRLMRKLFKCAVSYAAERKDSDMRTLILDDLSNAIAELTRAEQLIASIRNVVKIGYVQ